MRGEVWTKRDRRVLMVRRAVRKMYTNFGQVPVLARSSKILICVAERSLLPMFDQFEANCDYAIQRLIGIDDAMGSLWKRISQFRLYPMCRCANEIWRVAPRLNARYARGLDSSKEQELRLGRLAHGDKNVKYAHMPDIVDHEVLARLKSASG